MLLYFFCIILKKAQFQVMKVVYLSLGSLALGWPERQQLFCVYFCVFVCTQLPDDLNALWAYITFYGGECQLNLNKKVTHLVVKEPKGVSAALHDIAKNVSEGIIGLYSISADLRFFT